MAFGKKNHVKVDPLAYNLILLGESKIGKTTLIKEVCEKLGGEDCYLFLELGAERGADCIEGINYINCPEWNKDYDEYSNSAGFADVCEDIIENKSTDYPNLRVVIWDTYDQIIKIAEKETIRQSNNYYRKKNKPDKIAESINEAWGSYGRGDKKAMELMFDMMERLDSVGVKTYVIGHAKRKDQNDMSSESTYQVITSDQQNNYFSELKKMFPFLGVAYIDREIANVSKEKNGKKTAGKIKSETRRIRFRDENYSIDSGTRFAGITSEPIDFTADAFIKAITDAIVEEQKKSGVPLEKAKKEQDKEDKAEAKRVANREKENKLQKELNEVVSEIMDFCKINVVNKNKEAVEPILAKCKEMGYSNPKEISDLDDAKTILAMTLK